MFENRNSIIECKLTLIAIRWHSIAIHIITESPRESLRDDLLCRITGISDRQSIGTTSERYSNSIQMRFGFQTPSQ